MTHASTTDLRERLEREDKDYLEVLSEESVSVELARYPNSQPKTPHKTDELYVILSGSGQVHVGPEQHAVTEGDVIYVEQGTEHDFVDIEDEITALVVFTDAEESVLGQNI